MSTFEPDGFYSTMRDRYKLFFFSCNVMQIKPVCLAIVDNHLIFKSMENIEDEWRHRARQNNLSISKPTSISTPLLNGCVSYIQLFDRGSSGWVCSWPGKMIKQLHKSLISSLSKYFFRFYYVLIVMY